MSCIVVSVHFHEGRFHGLDTEGRAEWPPSPARLFQALVAAASKGAVLPEADKKILEWLEGLAPPVIAAPASHAGQSFSHFMPNNDLDAKGGDPRRIGEVRSATKHYRPRIFNPQTPVLYVWSLVDDAALANRICELAERLYQLGRGVDMAWAVGVVVDEAEAESRLMAYPGAVYRPALNGAGNTLPCPDSGSLDSLVVRHAANRGRFKNHLPNPTKKASSRTAIVGQTFAQPPKPHFRQVAYGCPAIRLLYELRDGSQNAGLQVWPLREAGALVKALRDDCADRLEASLKSQFPDQAGAVKRVFGLCRDATEVDKASRIRIIPLPSIGHPQADRGIRRILVEIPSNCPIRVQDIGWAFSGFCKFDTSTGEIAWMLTKAEEQAMLGHYGIGGDEKPGFRRWHTVTPMVLPIQRPHGRNNGTQRACIEERTANAVVQALRHAGAPRMPATIRVQREPFDAKGALAQDFATNTRFDVRRFWHVELSFAQPTRGPLLAGNGRYFGLGLMAPVEQTEGVRAFAITAGLQPGAKHQVVARALRRAVMALVQTAVGKRQELSVFFTGHEQTGRPARRGGRTHLAFVCDAVRNRLLILAPHVMERRAPYRDERDQLALLDTALQNMRTLRAGSCGVLSLEPRCIDLNNDPLFSPSKGWVTQTDYQPTRYSKNADSDGSVAEDVTLELLRRGYPSPVVVNPTSVAIGPRGGISAVVTLTFATAVRGPLILGRSSNFGGGLFSSSQQGRCDGSSLPTNKLAPI